jgi:ribosomal protein S21
MENSEIKKEETVVVAPVIVPLKFTGMRVEVRPSDNKDGQIRELEKAMKVFKKKLERDDVLRVVKERRYYTKPSALKRAEAKKLKNRKV